MKMNELPLENKTVENLLKMRIALLELPERNFDMDSWKSKKTPCLTTFCLLGAYVEKYGEETGLRFVPNGIVLSTSLGSSGSTLIDSSKAIGIDEEDAFRLFIPTRYDAEIVSKSVVLELLDEMIEKYSHG